MGNMSIPLQVASHCDGQEVFVWSNCLLDLSMDFLISSMVFCIRCIVSCGSTSLPWLVFFFAALLWGSMIHKHSGRWMWLGSISVISWNWKKYCCHSTLVSTLLVLLLSVLSLTVSQAWNPHHYNWAQVLEVVTVISLCPFTLISVLMPLVLLVISLVFLAPISMP